MLLDAAAFVPTNPLDLGRYQPDFVAVSFYKMFGYPTGIGALVAQRAALEKLHRPWFSGGTISAASVQGDRHFMTGGAEAFEDGTVDYLGMPAVEYGLDFLESIGMSTIHERVQCLTGWLLEQLLSLRHQNGKRLVRLYGPVTARGRGLRSISTMQTVALSTIRRSTLSPLSATFHSEPDVSATPVQERLHSVSQKTSSLDVFATQTTEWIART